MQDKFICEECSQEMSQQKYELQDTIFCPECGGRMGKLNPGESHQRFIEESHQKRTETGAKKRGIMGILWGMVLLACLVLSGILTYSSIFSLYQHSFGNQMIVLGIPLFSGLFTGSCFSLLRWFLVRRKKMRRNILFRLVQTSAVLVTAFFVTGMAIDGARQYNLRVTEETYRPVIQDIEKIVTETGHPPTDILKFLSAVDPEASSGYFPRRVDYYRDDNTYSLAIPSGSADIDGTTNYFDSRKNKWVTFHNDSLQNPEYSENAITFIQSYQFLPRIDYVYEKSIWKRIAER